MQFDSCTYVCSSLMALTELCKEISEAMHSTASLWRRMLSRRNLFQQSCISTHAWNCICWTWTARYDSTKGPIQEIHESWGNRSPEQAIKYTRATLICFGPGKIIMELTGYFWGCVKETYTGPILKPSEVRGRIFLISASFGWDAWFPCAADTFTNYWYPHMCLWTGRYRKMPCSVYHEMNSNAAVE